MLEELIEIICELTGTDIVNATDTFLDVGIDSLTYVQIIVEIEQKYGIEFADDELMIDDKLSIAEFVRITEEKCKKRHCTV